MIHLQKYLMCLNLQAKESTTVSSKQQNAVSAALAAGVPAGQQRRYCAPPPSFLYISRVLCPISNFQNYSVSCVADTSTQREVVVECFAPYDDHRWVNIGKVREMLLFSRSIGAHNSLKGAGSDGP